MELTNLLTDHRRLADFLHDRISAERMSTALNEASNSTYRQAPPQQKQDTIRRLVTRIDLSLAMMVIRLEKTALARALGCHGE